MKKYYSIRVVMADNREEAVDKVCNQEFDESDDLCDRVITADEMAVFCSDGILITLP